MTIHPESIDVALSAASGRLDNALVELQAGKQKLLDANGARIFSDDQHQQREAALMAAFDREVAYAEGIAQEVRQVAEAELARLDGAGLLDGLSADEMQRAATLRSFVKEDVQELPTYDLAARLNAVAAGSDKVEKRLYARYVARRLEEDGTARRDRSVQAAVEALRAALPDDTRRRRKAEERLAKVRELERAIFRAQFESRGGIEREIAAQRARVSYGL